MGARLRVGPGELTALAFLSGMCALGYEVLFLRHLTTVLGDALHVHAALLSTFLLGVGAGAWLAWRGHRWLPLVEALVGAYALCFPHLTAGVVASPLYPRLVAQPWTAAALTAVLVAPAAFLVGVGLPLFSGYVKATGREVEPAFQRVYGGYNLGAVVGVLAVELVLVGHLGIRGGLVALAGVNLTVAGALALGAGSARRRPAVSPRRFPRRILAAVVLASGASAVFQIFLLRSMDLVLGPHRGNFAMGLAVVLGGIAGGAWLVARSRLSFSDALLLLPVPLLAAYALGVSPGGLLWGGPAGGATPALALLARLGYGALLGFVPMVLFGATLPALMRQEQAVAREAGVLLGLSGAAAAAGYVLYVGVLAPRLSGGGLLALLSAVALLAAVLAAPVPLGRVRTGWVATVVLAAMGVAVVWNEADFQLAVQRARVQDADVVQIFRWAGESATLVTAADERWISYNGHPSIRTSAEGVVNTAELVGGVVPALNAPALGRAVVLGLGAGITAGAAARVFDTVDVVEINRAFLEMAPHLRRESLDVLGEGGARLHLGDGRAWLASGGERYDAVINSVPAPTVSTAGKLYTREFYALVRSALRPGGVFATWVSSEEMSAAGAAMVLRTLAGAFPRCALHELATDYHMAVCSTGPGGTTRRAGDLPLAGPLEHRLREGMAGRDPRRVLDESLVAGDLFAVWSVPPGAVNTDDAPLLEFLVLGGRDEGGALGLPRRTGSAP